ncbi:uncharacterized protein LOC115633116 [Scaptodrosophila lebanonensis]|uniref:Uncharacterized protein LOC115633116 n=1 Tax=Drosophila lebanonensis TaxID=7225 RepID=A0A6J2UE22_DROLE|nr:uncharacterized protein LOC115633116 [Scaptodrosophila lebanonensis]
MRPGPGLVVMALAFISGARRGSTSSSSSSSSSSTSGSSAATLPSTYDSTTESAETNLKSGSGSFLLPTFLLGGGSTFDGGGGVRALRPPQQQDQQQDSDQGQAAFGFDSHRRPAHAAPLHLQLPSHLRLHYDDPRARTELRRVRSLESGQSDDSASASDIVGRAGGTEVAATGKGAAVSAAQGPESSEATLLEEGTTDEEDDSEAASSGGLPVQFPSQANDESLRGFDEDADIFALVAEGDLLSEESFDHLVKLSEYATNEEDDKIADTNEDADYSSSSSSSGLAARLTLGAASENELLPLESYKEVETDTETDPETDPQTKQPQRVESQPNNDRDEREHQEPQLLRGGNSNSNIGSNNNKREANELPLPKQSVGVYAARLVGQQNGGIAAPDQSAAVVDKISSESATVKRLGALELKKSILGTTSPLTRLNPWISACDLAQPGTGTDLQGQCSAGTLPMAWVDEGPGPPTCPRSCAEQQPINSNNNNNYYYNNKQQTQPNDNKMKYFINNNINTNTNTFNYKSHTQQATQSTSDMADQLIENIDDRFKETIMSPHPSHLRAERAHADAGEAPQQQQQQQQQQQCLDYLGDAAETSPQHLCSLKAPSQLLTRLRQLRLRNCCERSVFSALHTLALNATLSDSEECERILGNLLDVDALANRITCELAEILFRFDCRQMYSLINQCDDCKEAYRRWVCSTLVPYFAEHEDIAATPTAKAKTATSQPVDDRSTTATKSKRTARNVGEGVGGNKHKSLELISNNNKSNIGNNMNERQINQELDDWSDADGNGDTNSDSDVAKTLAETFYNVVGLANSYDTYNNSNNERLLRRRKRNSSGRCKQPEQLLMGQEQQQQEQQQLEKQHFNNFISTANNEDPCATDPVISKLQKRSTRKAEFRKRRRIRPCLSVCQTVEQKCPYLLPADRAPALPTQYAGEPTFVCLDQNIPETGEQLKKSSYGPNSCCYTYCNGVDRGLCTVCDAFALPEDTATSTNRTRHVHNITLTLGPATGEHARAASVALALKNVSTAPADQTLEKLRYYAHHDSIYYYDDDDDDVVGTNMPDKPLSDGCAPVPSVSTRCTIPYYASSSYPQRMQAPQAQKQQLLLVCLSALLGLLSSCGAARQRRQQRGVRGWRSVNCAPDCHELMDARQSLKVADAGHSKSDGISASASASHAKKGKSTPKWRVRATKCISIRRNYNQGGDGGGHSGRNRNYRYFYYYNYNINDWWRRWRLDGL